MKMSLSHLQPRPRQTHLGCRSTHVSRGQRVVATTSKRAARCSAILDSYRAQKALEQNLNPPVDGDDDEVCPVECVHELQSKEEFDQYIAQSDPDRVLVVDFYKPSCGACRYIAGGFLKLCKAEDRSQVVFLKHNVVDEETHKLTDLARHFEIRAVPRFHFYRGGELVESYATRDKLRISNTINELARRRVLWF